MESHIKALSSSCFYHIRSFKQIRSSLDYDMAISVASALVSSRLNHVNSMVLLWSIQIAFSTFRKHWLELLGISAHMALHSHPLHSAKNFIGYLLNGVYISNWQPWRIRHYTLASHLIPYQSFIQFLLLSYLIVQANSFIPGLWHGHFWIASTQRTHTNSAIFLFSSALCSTMQSWVWLACFSNLCTKDLELTPCQYSRFSITPYFSSASQTHYFQSAYLSPWWPPLLSAPWFFRDYGAI